jgi:oligosaccharyltransferase complex subunit beta
MQVLMFLLQAYGISLSEHTPSGDWKPFKVPAGDKLQLEITMLDPYVRTNLQLVNETSTSALYMSEKGLKLPDVYGVFSLKVTYQRKGYSFLNEKTTVPVRHFKHNEYPRFITSAFPYYTSVWSMIVSLWIFVAVYLFHKSGPSKLKSS